MKWLGIIAAIVIAIVAYRTTYPSVTLRYRLAIEAEVDGQPRVGSGVIEVTYREQPRIAWQAAGSVSYRGEAIALDLDSRGTLFVLLKAGSDPRSGPEWIVLRAFNLTGDNLPRPVEQGVKRLERLSGSRQLALTSLPLLVRFRDLDDPKTVERVDPLDLGSSFGANTRLVRATLTIVPTGIWPLNQLGITGQPITTGIDRKLNWLPRYYNIKLDGQRYGSPLAPLPLANSLGSGFFKTGL